MKKRTAKPAGEGAGRAAGAPYPDGATGRDRAERSALLYPSRHVIEKVAAQIIKQFGSPPEEEDLVQEGWTLTSKVWTDRDPKRAAYKTFISDDMADLGLGYERQLEPDERVIQAERSANLHAALKELPENEQKGVAARDFDDLTCDQASEKLGIASVTVRRHHQHAFDTIRARLGEDSNVTSLVGRKKRPPKK